MNRDRTQFVLYSRSKTARGRSRSTDRKGPL